MKLLTVQPNIAYRIIHPAVILRASERRDKALQTPSVAFCEIRQRLLQGVAVAVSELVAIQNEHLKAIINGEPNFDGYDGRLRKATAIKDERKRAFMAHVKEHGC